MTNLEKLQEMDYEEMAKFLLDRTDEPRAFCPPETNCRSGGCRICWERWLRREADNEDDEMEE